MLLRTKVRDGEGAIGPSRTGIAREAPTTAGRQCAPQIVMPRR
jgi:hypothetical protein